MSKSTYRQYFEDWALADAYATYLKSLGFTYVRTFQVEGEWCVTWEE